jgi:hypothetical protein
LQRRKLKKKGDKPKLKLRDRKKLMLKKLSKLRRRLHVKKFSKKRGKQRQIDLQS